MNYAGFSTFILIIITCGLTTGLPSDFNTPLDLSKLNGFVTPIPSIPDFAFKNLPDLSALGRLPDPCEENIPDFLSCPVEDIRAVIRSKDGTFGTAVTCNCNKDKRLVVSMSCDRKSDGKWKYISATTCDSSPWTIHMTLGTGMLIVALVISLKFNLILCITIRRIRNHKILRVVNIQMPRTIIHENSTRNPPPYQQMA